MVKLLTNVGEVNEGSSELDILPILKTRKFGPYGSQSTATNTNG